MLDSKDKKGRDRRRSIDGIVVGSARHSQDWSTRRPGLSAPAFHPGRLQAQSNLGSDLRRAEGFHPMRSGSGGLGASAATAEASMLLDEPIVLDDEVLGAGKKAKTRRGLWHGRITLKRVMLALLAIILAGGIYFGIK